ncbi:hypothetical protein CCP3SC15_1160001 [Gammaproteobacteria bacterium]
MSIDDKVLKVMKGINQAVATRGWCLVEGGVGVGKTRATQEALHQIGWEAVWKGVSDLEGEEARQALRTEPKELLVLDGLVDEWVPAEKEQMPDRSWTSLYSAVTVAMARAEQGLMTVVCAIVCRDEEEKHPELDDLPGCVAVILR